MASKGLLDPVAKGHCYTLPRENDAKGLSKSWWFSENRYSIYVLLAEIETSEMSSASCYR
jgi:hypothetical protein